jgi:hypothetical protein
MRGIPELKNDRYCRAHFFIAFIIFMFYILVSFRGGPREDPIYSLHMIIKADYEIAYIVGYGAMPPIHAQVFSIPLPGFRSA